MLRSALLLLAVALGFAASSAQPASVKQYVQQVAAGWTTDAKKALPDLLIEYPDDPGVLFLHAALVDDSKKAAPLLERIVEAHPKSEWADDAMARLVIFAATKNEADRAKKLFATMRDQFSQSDLLPLVYDVLRSTVGVPSPTERMTQQVAAPKKVETAPPAMAKPFTIVTKKTASKIEAIKLMEQLKTKRLLARMSTETLKGKTMYIVSVGQYETESDAAADAKAVQAVCKCTPSVIKR